MGLAILIIFIIILVIVICITAFVASTYNNLIKLKNKVKNSWAHIDAQLQRRFDLIPNLVEIVKGYAEHETLLLEKIESIMTKYTTINSHQEKLSMDAQLSTYLKSLCTMSEKNPGLKSNVQFLKLQNALTEIEEDISYARQFYNDAVTIYNNKLQMFPNNMIASMFSFKEEELFDAEAGAEKAPKIRLNKIHRCPICGATVSNDSNNCEYCGCSLY